MKRRPWDAKAKTQSQHYRWREQYLLLVGYVENLRE
jgi:hypothetical protein